MKRITLASSALVLVAALSGCTSIIEGDEGGDELDESSGTPGARARAADMRIAIVGAGASGLTAAYTLKNLGYTNVTVLEKELRVGGKVNSLVLGDVRAEFGAVFASPDYRVVLGLANELGVPYVQYDNPRFVLDDQNRKQTYAEYLTSRYSTAEIGAAVAAYANVLATFPEIEQDGFVGLPPELEMPFAQFATAYGIGPVADMAKSLVVGFGYGYYETAPAIYILKILTLLVKPGPAGLESPPYFVFPTGYQSLWQAVADKVNVRLGARVTKIERSSTATGPVKVTINGFEKKEYDAVIVSAPLNTVSSFVALNTAEKALFAKLKSLRYFVTLFTAVGIPQSETVFVHGNSKPSRINHVVAWGNPGSLPIYIAYQIADPYISSTAVTLTLAADLLTLIRAVFIAPVVKKEWDYFPFADTATLRAGFYEQIDAMQGKRGLYFVGSALSFETVEHTARFAESLVLDNFPDLN